MAPPQTPKPPLCVWQARVNHSLSLFIKGLFTATNVKLQKGDKLERKSAGSPITFYVTVRFNIRNWGNKVDYLECRNPPMWTMWHFQNISCVERRQTSLNKTTKLDVLELESLLLSRRMLSPYTLVWMYQAHLNWCMKITDVTSNISMTIMPSQNKIHFKQGLIQNNVSYTSDTCTQTQW